MSAVATLRGYIVDGGRLSECAVLVFAASAQDAKRLGWHTIVHQYEEADDYIDVRAHWCREADPERWGVTAPTVIEPDGCVRCDRWYAAEPVDPESGLCTGCAEEGSE